MNKIKTEKLQNCRDLGGFVTTDGKRVKEKRLIRSETLFNASENDLKKLTNEYQLKKIIDFRTDIECEQKPDPKLEAVEYIHNPILEAETLGITREKIEYKDFPKLFENVKVTPLEYMQEMYTNIVAKPYAKEHYKIFFEELLKNENGSCLWHCSAGKDRVGIGTALLLTALGVDRETIISDYLFTAKCYLLENTKLRLMIVFGVRDKLIREYLRYLLDVKREYIEASFRYTEENYGSTMNYLEQVMGLDEEKIKKLKEMYLEN